MSSRLPLLFLVLLTLIFAPISFAEDAPAKAFSFTKTEVTVERDGLSIYGELLMPDKDGPLHLVILSHGFGGNHEHIIAFVQGILEDMAE